jgi:hypothetical protein
VPVLHLPPMPYCQFPVTREMLAQSRTNVQGSSCRAYQGAMLQSAAVL